MQILLDEPGLSATTVAEMHNKLIRDTQKNRVYAVLAKDSLEESRSRGKDGIILFAFHLLFRLGHNLREHVQLVRLAADIKVALRVQGNPFRLRHRDRQTRISGL
jgi:hypothetical protein